MLCGDAIKKILSATILLGTINFLPVNFCAESLQIFSVAHAEVKNCTASDVAMLDFGENDEKIVAKVKKVARLRALQAAKEKAGVYLKTQTKTVNGTLTDDEIFAVTNNISEILSVNYEKFNFQAEDLRGERYGKEGYLYKATVTVKIDTAGLANFVNRDAQEKTKIIQQNKNLRRSLVEIDSNFEELRQNVKTKTPAQIQTDFNKLDKEIAVAEKIGEGNKFAYEKNYSAAVAKYNEAIEINPEDSAAQKNLEIIANKIELSDDEKANQFFERGLKWFNKGSYRVALRFFEIAQEYNPKLPDIKNYIKICKKNVGSRSGVKANKPNFWKTLLGLALIAGGVKK